MKKRKKKNKSGFKVSYIFLILVFASGITFLALSMFFPQKKTEKNDDSPNTIVTETDPEIIEPGRGGSDDDETDNNEAEQAAKEKTPKQNEDEPDTPTGSINASITRNEVINGKLVLGVEIYELLDGGSCDLYMENTNKSSITRSVKIVADASSSHCEDFNISVGDIESGSYNFTVKLKSGEKTNTIKGTIKI